MTFFLEKKRFTEFFSDFGSPIHGESNDILCASNGSKFVEKLKIAESYVALERKMYSAIFNNIPPPALRELIR